MDLNLAKNYKSPSQIIRVISEPWVLENIVCPLCSGTLTPEPNNTKVVDCVCAQCAAAYQVKASRHKKKKMRGSAYAIFMDMVQQQQHPHFIFLYYNRAYQVTEVLFLPKEHIHPDLISQGRPLKGTARRHGWVGYTLNLGAIPVEYFQRLA